MLMRSGKLQSWGRDIKWICYTDILIYSNVENLVLVESQPEIIRPLRILQEFTFLYSNI